MPDEWWKKPRWTDADWGNREGGPSNKSNDSLPELSESQIAEAKAMAEALGLSFMEALARLRKTMDQLGFSSIGDLDASPNQFSYEYIELSEDLTIPHSVFEVITESMARENTVIATGYVGDSVDVAMSSPDVELLDKLRFVLNRLINPKIASKQSIVAAIERHYGVPPDENV